MIEKSIEINGRIAEIKAIAASIPQGGNTDELKIELTRLANWANQTLLYLGRIEDKACQGCSECNCQR